MTQNPLIYNMGLLFSVILPFFNLPLMFRMVQRKSSEDISLVWAIGVWVCIVAVAPAAWTSSDSIFRIFSVINLIFFSGVVSLVVYFRFKKRKPND